MYFSSTSVPNESGQIRSREHDYDDHREQILLAEKARLDAQLARGGLDVNLEIAIHNRIATVNTMLSALYSHRGSSNSFANDNRSSGSNAAAAAAA